MNCFLAIRFSSLRLTIANRAPCSANALATPPAIPVPPPVTNATLPCKMLSANILSAMERNLTTEAQRHRESKKWLWRTRWRVFQGRSVIVILALWLCASVVNLSCGSKPTDMRALAPADSLVYLETSDLAAALQPIVDSKPFNEG